ncbi:ATP-binding cassette domain-containing protein [Gordonia sp. HNM0687]|uniref:ATP-binding cassette domain-containing protein n=1 Tax=Gordonia mangrovi TaxID=2665643 RepID=A0A6L7GY67_9ACTN|nr:ABC transporter ATP-binding protein [Gordonia mangrovi]MXP24171.1 ATP-binding cassette domain-containing protein [Gordonia mangrovi]UVF76937.1 ABC transporter ATP-binding protein [Gordonia mangrovi]
MSEPVVELKGVHSGYNTISVIRGIDLIVNPGEVVALLGANGAGKTTTLRTISGIVPISEGTLTVMGTPILKNRPWLVARRGVSHVPEERGLFFQLTVKENLILGARRGKPDYDRVFHYFPALAKLSNRKAGLLSGGEQQMLATARAAISGSKLIMVDEMSLGLAPIIVERLLPVLKQVAVDTGAGILLVEQHIELALEVADRGYVLSKGVIDRTDTAEALLRDRHLLEQSYLGEIVI